MSTLYLIRIELYHLAKVYMLLILLLLPVVFDPFQFPNVEISKVKFLLAVTVVTLLLTIVRCLARAFRSSTHYSPIKLLCNLWQFAPIFVPVLTYSLVQILATILSIDIQISLWSKDTGHGVISTLTLIVLFVVVVSTVKSWDQINWIITIILLGSIPTTLYGVIQYFGLDPLPWFIQTASPVQSTLGHTTFFGAYLITIMPFAFARLIAVKPKKLHSILIDVIVVLLQFLCLLFTLARGSMLGLIAGSISYAWLISYRWRFIYRIGLVMILLFLGLYLFVFVYYYGVLFFPRNLNNTMTEVRLGQMRQISNMARSFMWNSNLLLIPHVGFLGYGPETFSIVFHSQYPTVEYPELVAWMMPDPHNIFLSHLFSTGFAGLLTFLWILIIFYRTTLNTLNRISDWNQYTTTTAIISAATSYLVQAQFNPDAITSLSLFWVVLAVGTAIASRSSLLNGLVFKA